MTDPDATTLAALRLPTVYLCRHRETALNAGGRLRGHSDAEHDDASTTVRPHRATRR